MGIMLLFITAKASAEYFPTVEFSFSEEAAKQKVIYKCTKLSDFDGLKQYKPGILVGIFSCWDLTAGDSRDKGESDMRDFVCSSSCKRNSDK